MTDTETENKVEETAGDTPTETAPARPRRKRKHNLPAGWITPVQFHHELVDTGRAPETMSTAQIYIMSRAKKTNGMPVFHFDAEGNQYDELQVDPATGETTTRPGIQLEEGLKWWDERPKRQAGKKKAEAATTDGTAAEEDEEKATVADEAQADADEDELEDLDDEAAVIEAE